MTITVVTGDITKIRADAIVNAANTSLAPGGGVCGAIHRAAGPALARACRALGGCVTGEAEITEAFGLPAKYVIHTVGPVWHGGSTGEAAQLAGCYRRSLDLADEKGLHSIAFPAISTGIFGYPVNGAARVAVSSVQAWLKDHAKTSVTNIYFVCFNDADHEVYDRAALENSQ